MKIKGDRNEDLDDSQTDAAFTHAGFTARYRTQSLR